MEQSNTADIGPIEKMLQGLNAASVFGEPVHEGDAIILPVARVQYGFGYGSGGVAASDDEDAAATEEPRGGGSAGGAGAGGGARPVGYIHISQGGVRYEPIAEPNIVPLAGIAFAAWAIFWITATLRVFACRRC